MNWKSTAVVSGATLIATWLGWTSTPPPRAVVAVVPAPARESRPVGGLDIQQQADRLQVRVRAQVDYHDPTRNPFRFGAPVAHRRHEPPVASASAPPPAIATQPLPLTLSGIAADTIDGAVRRTAIISSPSGLLLVKEGDRVVDYAVAHIDAAAVELVAPDGATRTLSLTP